MDRFIVISGCSGGGKSTLIEALGRVGHGIVDEPGRRVVAHELATGGARLPWSDPAGFARAVIATAVADYRRAGHRPGLVFFDRSLIDAELALAHVTGQAMDMERLARHPYRATVFLVPPWPEIYVQDDARRHGLAEAESEYERLHAGYRRLGYRVTILPRAPLADRVAAVLTGLELPLKGS